MKTIPTSLSTRWETSSQQRWTGKMEGTPLQATWATFFPKKCKSLPPNPRVNLEEALRLQLVDLPLVVPNRYRRSLKTWLEGLNQVKVSLVFKKRARSGLETTE